MFDFNDPCISVQMCRFEAYIQKAHVVIKFPCSYFVEWRTINNRYSVTTQTKAKSGNNQAVFNEKITFYTEMVYNSKKRQYYSKETFLVLNLVSKSRPDQNKLVGRISIDLAEILNRNRYSEQTHMKLSYCSVEGSLLFSINLLSKRQSNLNVRDLDRSAFTYDPYNLRDYFSLNPLKRMTEDDYARPEPISNANNQVKPLQLNGEQTNKNRLQKYTSLSPQKGQDEDPESILPKFNSKSYSMRLCQNDIQSYNKNRLKQYKRDNDEIISFNNDRDNYESPRSNYQGIDKKSESKQNSLIQKLEQRNLEDSRGRAKSYNYAKQQGNAASNQSNKYAQNKKKPILAEVNQQMESGQIKKQNIPNLLMGTFSKNHKVQRQQMIASSDVTKNLADNIFSSQKGSTQMGMNSFKPLQKQSSGKFSQIFSETGQSQLVQIVNRLQSQKREQQGMIKSLKQLIIKNQQNQLKKDKKLSKQDNKIQQIQFQYKQKVQKIEKNLLKKQNQVSELNRLVSEKNRQLKQKQEHVFQLIGKIKKLQNYISSCQQAKKQQFRLKEEQHHKAICQSLMMIQNLNKLVQEKQNKKSYTSNEQSKELALKIKELENQIMNLKNENESFKNQFDNFSLKRDSISPFQSQRQSINNNKARQSSQMQKSVEAIHQNQISETLQQNQGGFKFTLTKDKDIYKQMEEDNNYYLNRIKQLQQQNQKYRQLLRQQKPYVENTEQNDMMVKQGNNNKEQEICYQGETAFQINVVKDKNIFQNYQNLEKENQQFCQRIKYLEQQVSSYKEMINSQMKDQQQKRMMDQQNQICDSPIVKQQIFSAEQIIEGIIDTPVFKITLTKDKNIFQEQQKQNQEYSKRVIELQEQVQRYKELINSENNISSPGRSSSKEQQRMQSHNAGQSENYEQFGLRITLTKDKNIYQNQEQQIKDLTQTIAQQQAILTKYKNIFGPLEAEPVYKVSITRDENIYQEQQKELRDMNKTIQMQQQDLVASAMRISILERQLQELRPSCGDGQFKINIKRDQNIYDQQEKDLQQLSRKVIELEEQLKKDKEMQKSQKMGMKIGTQKTQSEIDSCKEHIQTIQELLKQIKLVEQEKQLLEEQIGALEQDKFGMNSTENELRIKIQELEEQIRMLKLQNSRFYQEIDYLRNGSDILNGADDNQRANNPNVQQQQIIEELKFQYENTKKSLILLEQQLQMQQQTIYDLEARISTLMQEKQILLNLNRQAQQKLNNNSKNQERTNDNGVKQLNSPNLLQQISNLKKQNQQKIIEIQQKCDQKLLQATKKIQQITLNEQARKIQINQKYQTQILAFKQNINCLQNTLKQKDLIIQKLQSQKSLPEKTTIQVKQGKSNKVIEGTISEISSLITQKQHLSQNLSKNLLPTLSKCIEQRQINSEKQCQEETMKFKSLISKQVQKTKAQIMKLGKPYHQKAIMINYFKPIQQMIV